MARPSNPTCTGLVYQRGLFPCTYPGKVQRGGEWYCGVHDPERQRARDEARRKRWRLQVAARDAARAKAEQRQRDIKLIVRRMATGDFWRPRGQDRFVCVLCGREASPLPPRSVSEWLHLDGCVVILARAIVAEWDTEKSCA